MIFWIIISIVLGYIISGLKFCRFLNIVTRMHYYYGHPLHTLEQALKAVFYPLIVIDRCLQQRHDRKHDWYIEHCNQCRSGSWLFDRANDEQYSGYYCDLKKGRRDHRVRKCSNYKYKWWWLWGCKRLKHLPFPFTQAEIDEGHRRTIEATIKQGLEKWQKER